MKTEAMKDLWPRLEEWWDPTTLPTNYYWTYSWVTSRHLLDSQLSALGPSCGGDSSCWWFWFVINVKVGLNTLQTKNNQEVVTLLKETRTLPVRFDLEIVATADEIYDCGTEINWHRQREPSIGSANCFPCKEICCKGRCEWRSKKCRTNAHPTIQAVWRFWYLG